MATAWTLRQGDFEKLKQTLPPLSGSDKVSHAISIIERHYSKYDVKVYFSNLRHDEDHRTFVVLSRGNIFTIDVPVLKDDQPQDSGSWYDWMIGR